MAVIGFDAYKREVYRPALDGLRAISIVLVFFNHVGGPGQRWSSNICGWTGVWVFFLISGYLIYMLLLREEAAEKVRIGSFYIRRVARIFPSYFVVIALYMVLCWSPLGHGKGPAFFGSLPYLLTFNAEYAPAAPAFGQAWTLGIEEKFYLILPIIGFVVLGGRRSTRVGLMLFTLAGCMMLNDRNATAYAALFSGALLADLLDRPGGFRRLERLADTPWWLYLAVIASAYAVARFHDYLGLSTAAYLGWLALCSGFILLDGLLTRGTRFRVLASQPLRAVGRLSYAFYLVHVIGINLLSPLFRGNALHVSIAVLLAFIVSLGLAWVLHHGVERPGIRLGKRLAASLHPSLIRRDTDDVPTAVDAAA